MTLRHTVPTARSRCSAASSLSPSWLATLLTKSTTAGKSSASARTVTATTDLSSFDVPCSSDISNTSLPILHQYEDLKGSPSLAPGVGARRETLGGQYL